MKSPKTKEWVLGNFASCKAKGNWERERERDYEFPEDTIIVREGLRKSEEDDDVRGETGESALEEVVEKESGASLDAVLDQKHSAA